VGQEIGWVEGFKALTDLYGVVEGEFAGTNPALDADPTLTDTDCYNAGWLYNARGTPEPNSVDVHGYTQLLDLTIDKMQDKAGDDGGSGGGGA
jgi:glycine cleavage system H protein